MEDYYSVLGVSKTATEAEIRAAYRRQAMATCPHLGLESEGKFEEIALAYITLSDPTRRQQYDDFLATTVGTSESSDIGLAVLRMYHRNQRAFSFSSADDLFFMEMCSEAVELTMAEPIRWSRQAEIKTAWRCPIDYQVRSAIEHYCQKGMPGVWEHLTLGRSDCPPHIERRVYNELETDLPESPSEARSLEALLFRSPFLDGSRRSAIRLDIHLVRFLAAWGCIFCSAGSNRVCRVHLVARALHPIYRKGSP